MRIGSIENAFQHCLGLGRDIPRVHCNTALSPPSVETSLLPALNQSATAQNLGSCLQHCFFVACGPQSVAPALGKPAGR